MGSGVDVTVLTPGPTDTEGLQSIDGFDPSKLPIRAMPPERVARVGLEALGKKALVIPGVLNKFADALGKYVLPRTLAAKLAASVMAKAVTDR
jgi:short-subunit dehydrogenase